jgi:glucose-6-phosphate isomerase
MMFGVFEVGPTVRSISELKDVLHDKSHALKEGDSPAYFMYRDLGLSEEDKRRIRTAELRYDITVIPPKTLGAEFVKTFGHYHPNVPSQKMTYPEVYQVLDGVAHYILQKEEGRVVDVLLISAGKMDVIVIPPDYGHVTINPGKKTLKMANWVCRNFNSIYEPYARKGGAAYFELSSGELIANSAYGSVPEIARKNAQEASILGLESGEDMYRLVDDLSSLDFLKRPQKHLDFFRRCFK